MGDSTDQRVSRDGRTLAQPLVRPAPQHGRALRSHERREAGDRRARCRGDSRVRARRRRSGLRDHLWIWQRYPCRRRADQAASRNPQRPARHVEVARSRHLGRCRTRLSAKLEPAARWSAAAGFLRDRVAGRHGELLLPEPSKPADRTAISARPQRIVCQTPTESRRTPVRD